MIWTTSSMWKGETAFLLAGGPSLKGFDAERLKNRRVLTINDSWRIAPAASINYFCDGSWWSDQMGRCYWSLKMERSFHDQIYKGYWVTVAHGFAEHPQVRSLRVTGERGLETDPQGLRHGSNAGYQAINLAYHLGAARIVLLGYDMRVNGTSHWHPYDKETDERFAATIKQSFLPHFDSLVEPLKEAGIEVINATPDSALEAFPKASLDDILKEK